MYQYSVKIKKNPGVVEKTYIWGGQSIAFNLKSSLFLVIRVPEQGEDIQIKTESKDISTPRDIGTLKAGELFTIPLNEIKGVYATCSQDIRVDCSIEFMSSDMLVPSLE